LYDKEYDESWKKLRNEYDVIKAATSGKESESMCLDTEDISAVTTQIETLELTVEEKGSAPEPTSTPKDWLPFCFSGHQDPPAGTWKSK
jgi:hypothetical protein